MKKYYIVSFSGGKDSTAMLLRMLELGAYQIDEVVNFDTGLEFPAMYAHIEKVKSIVEAHGVPFTILKADKSFKYYLLKYEYKGKNGEILKGYSWPNGRKRWCTALLKTEVTRKYIKNLKGHYDVYQYIGLASDEVYRLERPTNKNKHHIHPLVDWGWSEADALKYCYDKGYGWGGLYEIFARVSCWLCPLMRIKEAKKLWKYFPDLWEELKFMDAQTRTPWKTNYSVEQLERRFAAEEKQLTLL